jgi:hypothetical protein
MKRFAIVVIASCLPACSSSSGGGSPSGAADSGADAEQDSSVAADSGSGGDSTAPQDSGSTDTGTLDSGSDTSSQDAADSGTSDNDASDGACPVGWLTAPTVDPPIEVPADGGGVLLHAAGVGTQNYACTVTDGGTVWTFVGPSAALNDCNGMLIGHHMVSDGGAAFPEWIETSDGTYVVGHKLAAFTPDGGSGSVPWLLLQGVEHGGSGTLSQAAYIQRLYTDGGVAPGSGCDAGDTVQVPYGAEYYFYGP